MQWQGTLITAQNVYCTDEADGSAMPFGDPRGLARFRTLSRLSLRHAHRGCLGGAGLPCTWLPVSLQVGTLTLTPHPHLEGITTGAARRSDPCADAWRVVPG